MAGSSSWAGVLLFPCGPECNSGGRIRRRVLVDFLGAMQLAFLFQRGGNMDTFEIKGQRLIALSMLGCLVFNYPVLALFNRPGTAFGIPVLYAFLFAAWVLLIALMALVVEATDIADR